MIFSFSMVFNPCSVLLYRSNNNCVELGSLFWVTSNEGCAGKRLSLALTLLLSVNKFSISEKKIFVSSDLAFFN